MKRFSHCRLHLRAVTVALALFIPNLVRAADQAEPLTGAPPVTYRVAAILPLTGDGASWGISAQHGIEIALGHLNENTRKHLEVVFEDDALQPKNTVSAFERLVFDGRVDVLINVTSGTGNAVAPLTEKSGMTFFSIASDDRIAEGRPNVFMFYLDPADEAAAVVAEMTRRGYRSVAEVVAIQDGLLAGQTAFHRFADGKLELAASEQFPPGSMDFKGFLGRVRRARRTIDAVYILLMPGQVGAFAKQARELGLHMPLVGGINFENRGEVEAAHGALDGQWFVTNGSPTGEFLHEYESRFPGQPLACATNGHDIILLLAKAIDEKIEPKRLSDFLRRTQSFAGASGTVRMGANGRFQFPTSVKKITQSGYTTVR